MDAKLAFNLKIIPLNDKGIPAGVPFLAMFNPESFFIKEDVVWEADCTPGQQATEPNYSATRGRSFTMEFLLDGTGVNTSGVKIPVTANLYCTLVHPQIELKTEDARRVLKSSIVLKDAITQSGNTAGLMIGLMSADYSLISRSLKDVIAEPVRSVFIPGFEAVRSEAVRVGALGCGISGSGPTMFALSQSHEIALAAGEVMQSQFSRYQLKSEVYVSRINPEGAKILNK